MTEKKSRGPMIAAIAGALILSCCCATGVLGALGYNGFQRYEMQSRMSEVRYELTSISTAERAYCQGNGFFLPYAGPRTAPAVPWTSSDYAGDTGYRALGYEPFPSRHFTYLVTIPASTQGIEIQAVGDADGDGVTSTHTIACTPSTCDCAFDPASSGDPDEAINPR